MLRQQQLMLLLLALLVLAVCVRHSSSKSSRSAVGGTKKLVRSSKRASSFAKPRVASGRARKTSSGGFSQIKKPQVKNIRNVKKGVAKGLKVNTLSRKSKVVVLPHRKKAPGGAAKKAKKASITFKNKKSTVVVLPKAKETAGKRRVAKIPKVKTLRPHRSKVARRSGVTKPVRKAVRKSQAKKLGRSVQKGVRKLGQKVKAKMKAGYHKAAAGIKRLQSASKGGKRPTGPTKVDKPASQLKQLLNQPVVSMRIVERKMSTTKFLPNLEQLNPDWRNTHSGLEVITADGGRYLIHKGGNYGRKEGGNTVVTDAKHMSSKWREKSAWKQPEAPKRVTDLVKEGGKEYSFLRDNCHKASRQMHGCGGN